LRIIEPPKKVFSYIYRCSNELYLEPLYMMLESNELVGIVSIDSEECGVGIIDGLNCYPLRVITSGVPGKSSKGGSSARRFP
jgi:peptide chain release factor subunit 1